MPARYWAGSGTYPWPAAPVSLPAPCWSWPRFAASTALLGLVSAVIALIAVAIGAGLVRGIFPQAGRYRVEGVGERDRVAAREVHADEHRVLLCAAEFGGLVEYGPYRSTSRIPPTMTSGRRARDVVVRSSITPKALGVSGSRRMVLRMLSLRSVRTGCDRNAGVWRVRRWTYRIRNCRAAREVFRRGCDRGVSDIGAAAWIGGIDLACR